MQVSKINYWQMAILFQVYITGSSIINIQGPLLAAAKNAAWIALLLSTLIGFLILYLVLSLHDLFPEDNYVGQVRKIVGPKVTYLFIIPFILVVIYVTANIVYGMGQYFTTSMMRETPLYIFHVLILTTAALTAKAGIEVMARMFHLLLYLLFFIIFMMLLLPMSIYEVENLLPLAPDGIKPIINGIYVGFGFPYMDILYFAMILPFIQKQTGKSLNKWLYGGLFFNGILLSITIMCSIMGLGPLVFMKKFPLHLLAQLISIGEIIERVEAIFGIALILGSYMKIALLLFIIDQAISSLFKIKSSQLIYILSTIVFFLSLTMYKNEIELGESGSIMQPTITFFFGFIPLALTVIIGKWKDKNQKYSHE
ncbi:spore germination protein [Fictibacillus nanhaiensis]|uniref:GerAB/ArcD/ProY family transporter n=1 Tax=Fictibacillus nanhaiensis TaxID=742169 RepID=UPI001C950431|nr:endospore germination permease [Fictibacillus nanhaiensis]MBY6038030.1 spore germination protein [Fictibacillus nanhaiensis]